MSDTTTVPGGDRRERLEQELAFARTGLARAANAQEREQMESVIGELELKLERLILAIEIERQSDA